MNIRERNSILNKYKSLLNLTNKKEIILNINDYLNALVRPPITYYMPYEIINQLYTISIDSKLMSNPMKRFQLQNDILLYYRFKPLASGTNRRTFYCEYDPNIVLKIASDMIGRTDNISEFNLQHILLPFCPKIFDVDPTGTIMLSERVETMTEKDYKEVWFQEIFDLINDFYEIGYIFDDVGLYSFKNLGIRLGFGPVILDFPYMYKLDWDKLKCERIDPMTHERCNGTIGYNYDAMMSELICYKCKARYSAKYLASSMTGKSLNSNELGRQNTMSSYINTDIPVRVTKGNKVVFDPKHTIEVVQQPQSRPQQPIIYPQQQQFQQPQMMQQASIPQQQSQMSNDIMNSWSGVRYADLVNIPTMFHIPQQRVIPVDNEQPPQQTKQQHHMADSTKFQYYTEYTKNNTTYIYYPRNLKNDMIQWLKGIETTYGVEAALFIASRLMIEYISKANWQKKNNTQQQPTPQQLPPQQSYIPQQQPVQQVQPTIQTIPFPTESTYQTVDIMNKPTPVQTVIAPQTRPTSLKVEDPAHWDEIKKNIVGNDTPTQQQVETPKENHPTTGLEIMKPMSNEEIEAQEMKMRGSSDNMLGFPGIPMIDNMRFKEFIPRIKAMVDQRFNNFILSNDAETQAFQLSQDIARFIAPDIKNIMNDDGKGLLVTATRTTDTKNKDCYVIKTYNYGTPLFITTIYPEEQQVTTTAETLTDDEMLIPLDELVNFFESIVNKFDSSKYNDIEVAKNGLITFLRDAVAATYKGKITVPRAHKEATAYVNQAIKFMGNSNNKTDDTSPKPQDNVAAAL